MRNKSFRISDNFSNSTNKRKNGKNTRGAIHVLFMLNRSLIFQTIEFSMSAL